MKQKSVAICAECSRRLENCPHGDPAIIWLTEEQYGELKNGSGEESEGQMQGVRQG